jgi:RNA-dependent RNA polymerase
VITKNPALDPADVRLMNCISEDGIAKRCKDKGYPSNYFSSFNNCIVFPCKGSYPVTVQISGSDLDGDNFFICWDEHLLIEK